jgi:hypothetical protein
MRITYVRKSRGLQETLNVGSRAISKEGNHENNYAYC